MHHENSLDDLPDQIDLEATKARFENIMADLAELDRQAHENRSEAIKKNWENPSAAMLVANMFNVAAWITGNKKWREERPEEEAASVAAWIIGNKKWREECLEELAASVAAMRAGNKKWREKYPEKFAAHCRTVLVGMHRWQKENPAQAAKLAKTNLVPAMQWQKEHPEKVVANMRKARAATHQRRRENPEWAAACLANAHLVLKQRRRENPEWAATLNRRRIEKSVARRQQNAKARYEEQFAIIRERILAMGTGDARYCEVLQQCPEFTEKQINCVLNRAVRQGDLIKIKVSRRHTRYCLPAQAKAT